MADEVDIAQVQNEMAIEAALQYRQPVQRINPVGECHWCATELEPDSLKLYCNSECATKHDRYLKGIKK